jgi:DNA-binding transcriptional regulator WhiA
MSLSKSAINHRLRRLVEVSEAVPAREVPEPQPVH